MTKHSKETLLLSAAPCVVHFKANGSLIPIIPISLCQCRGRTQSDRVMQSRTQEPKSQEGG